MLRSSALAVWAVVGFCGLPLRGGPIEPNPPVDLVFRPARQTVRVGDTVQIGLYAVSRDEEGRELGVTDIEATLLWDPTALGPITRSCNGPYAWLFCGFPAAGGGADLGRLNKDFDDGDAQFLAVRQLPLNPPFFATADGRLVASFLFEALRETPSTIVEMPPMFGENHTRIFHAFIAAKEITGELGMAEIRIVPEPATLILLLSAPALFWCMRRIKTGVSSRGSH